MLEELSAIALLGIIVCQYYLIRGCSNLNGTIGQNGGVIHDQTARISDLLDELIQVVVDVVPDPSSSNPIAQTPNGIGDLLTMFLNNRMNMADTDTHGDTTKQEWEIYKSEDTTQVKTEV
ncbi:MAG: hypothetical protein ISR20_05965 [Candidatus Poseidonia sp.]|nr:hypothetical protein [Poseidonia sp.]